MPEKEDAEKVTEVSAEEAVASASLAQQSFVEELRRSLAKVELFNGKLDKYMEFLNEIDEKIKKGKPAVERAVQLENRVKELEKANQAINLNLNKVNHQSHLNFLFRNVKRASLRIRHERTPS